MKKLLGKIHMKDDMKILIKFLFSILVMVPILSKANDKLIYSSDFKSEYYLYDVSINQKKYRFMLDTGSGFTVLDTKIADEVSKKITEQDYYLPVTKLISAHNHKNDIQYYHSPTIFLGQEQIYTSAVIALDLSHLEAVLGEKIDGILGIDVFNQFIWEVDNHNGKLNIYKDKKIKKDYKNVISYRADDYPYFKLYKKNKSKDLNKQWITLHFALDTGAVNSSLDPIIKNHIIVNNYNNKNLIRNSVDFMNKTEFSDLVFVQDLEFGNEPPIKRMNFIYSKINKNLLGLDFFDRFDRFIFYPFKQKFYYNEMSSNSDPEPRRMIGVKNNDGLIELVYNDQIYLNSFGLENGDVIELVNNKKYTSQEIHLVRKILNLSKDVHLKVKRGDKILFLILD
ncbi:aspartyl protease family protein [Testudinibacter sp. P80/BLE/0925]|uniref:aspartyl protease family protein n=1 Tax=Testudinibacter sp. TW-1 TaxID=3417757 RepID=UPI003D36284D